MKGIKFEKVDNTSFFTQTACVIAAEEKNSSLQAKQKTKAETHVRSLVNHLIRWCQEHQASITTSVKGLCEGTLTKKTASSLRAILAAYQPETFLVANELLAEVENQYGPVPDVLVSAEAVLTRHGFVLNAVFTHEVMHSFAKGRAA